MKGIIAVKFDLSKESSTKIDLDKFQQENNLRLEENPLFISKESNELFLVFSFKDKTLAWMI